MYCGITILNLKEHMKSLHADEAGITKPTCSTCGKSFIRKIQLQKHMALEVCSYLKSKEYFQIIT